uniref:Phosphoribosylformylglycinamidine synthase n=1 Tax=Glossina austeni TaxID=7395 RepID=A0A1A9UK57_GLOAU
MIKNTLIKTPKNVLSAYSDNAAVILGSETKQFFANSKTKEYGFYQNNMHIVIKAETHNHPTAISPFSGASTGVGGEIRDLGSTGRGSIPKIGWSGFSVSNLLIPYFYQPWEEYCSYPKYICTALDIILHAPLGASEFNNEFGRPCLLGYFRTYEKYLKMNNLVELRGYHKPIMLSGGLGLIRDEHVSKKQIISGNKLIVLGNPGMKVGLGGASISSLPYHINPHISSIQCGNPEMERRCQEVISRCCELKKNNPILFIHDVGAANWMIDSNNDLDSYKLYQTVKELGKKFCPDLNLTIVVGKDSMFMRTDWFDKNKRKIVFSPPSLVISACARVEDVRATITPQLRCDIENIILFVNLGNQHQELGGTALSQVYQKNWNNTPDTRRYAYFGDQFTLRNNEKILYEHSRTVLRTWWSETTWKIQRLRDDVKSADQEHQLRQDTFNPGLKMQLTFNPKHDISAPFFLIKKFPKIAILREQGTNAYTEMAAAFYRAGFQPIDVHMNDLRFSSENILKRYHILVACGGFTYGDVLHGGSGWAKSILLNNKLRDMFESFFKDPNTLSLGICNGCQMMSELKEIMPGTEHWPSFITNQSCRFESRFILVEVLKSPSILLKDMQGSCIPISIAHSTGRAKFKNIKDLNMIEKLNLITLKYIDNYGTTAQLYPSNPNGSKHGIAALTNCDGRINIMMPHPERSFRSINFSYLSHDYFEEDSPWMRIFRNARKQIG